MKGLSPCEIKWRSPINRAAICFFLLLTYCATIYATFSYINTRAFSIEQTGPKLAKKKKKIILVDINGSQQTVFQNKEAQQSNSSSQKQLLVAHIISSDRETNESMRPQAWCMSWWRNWLLTRSETKHLWKFFCKSKYLTQQWLQSLKTPTVSCQTDMISLNTAKWNFFRN